MKKRCLGVILVICFLVNMQVELIAENTNVAIKVNGKVIEFPEEYGQPYIDENSRTMVPFRYTLESIGALVSWNNATRTAIAIRNDVLIEAPIGQQYIYKDGKMLINDTEAVIKDGRTYLPIRIVLEAFSYAVSWENETRTVVATEVEEQSSLRLIPSKFDLRTEGRVSKVKDQYDTGACWSFASLAAIESLLLPNGVFDFSEDHMTSNHGFSLEREEGGNSIISLSYLTRWSGPVLEVEDPFNDGETNLEAKAVKHVQEAQFIEDKDFTGIKRAIIIYGSVQSAMHIDGNLRESSYYNQETGAYYYNGTQQANHALVVVGWDDEYPKENFRIQPEKNGAFICKNSYGTDFGKEGYMYISYEDAVFATDVIVFTRVDDANNYDMIYQADWYGALSQAGYGDETAYFSNAYETKDETEALKAVSFYTNGKNSSYEIFLVENFKTKADFANMHELKRGTIDFPGYYTIDFELPIEISGKFAVVVKLTTPNEEFPVSMENNREYDWIPSVDINDGEGYMSYKGKVWDDTEELLSTNVCLKAFTKKIEKPEENIEYIPEYVE